MKKSEDQKRQAMADEILRRMKLVAAQISAEIWDGRGNLDVDIQVRVSPW